MTGVFGFIGLEIECGGDPAPVGVVTGGTVELFLDDAEEEVGLEAPGTVAVSSSWLKGRILP